MNPRHLIAATTIAALTSAVATGLAVAPAASQAAHASAFAIQSEEPTVTPTVTPLPPPPVPPPDAAGISATTPPLGDVSPNPVPTLPDALWLASGASTTVHFDIHGGRPYIPVVVDGVRREFLLSTLEPTEIDDAIYVADKPGAESLRTLQIGDIRLTDVHVTRARIAPFSLTYLGHQADGIIGSEFFARYPVTIDYTAGALTIYKTEDAAVQARPAGAAVLPLEIVGGSPAVACAIDGLSASPCLIDVDSDADLMLDWNSDDAQKMLHLGPTLSCMREAVPGREMFGRIARARDLSLGSLSIAQPLVRLPSPTSDPVADPLAWRTRIGGGVLDRFAATIDESGGTLVLSGGSPNSSAPAFDRSGLWLIWHSGVVVVRNVVEGSPGEAAGITAGDEILDVDGKPAIDLDAVRSLLAGDPGAQIAVTYQRGEHQGQAMLTLRTLI